MKEYTLLAFIGAGVAVLLDRFVLKTNVTERRSFWIFIAVMFAFKTLINGYLTWRPIVMYNEAYYLGIRIITIPVEDYVYGFSLITASIVVWEFMRQSQSNST